VIYYTADLHFGNEMLRTVHRTRFSNVEEMNEAIVRNWNRTVTDGDTVYVAGDVGYNGGPFPARLLARLRGHKHLIRGNHDTGLADQERLFDYFDSVTDLLEIDDGTYHITICHYPIVYIQSGYMVHGHIHNPEGQIYETLKRLSRVMNAGMDRNDFRPVTLQQLIENNRVFYQDSTRGEPTERMKQRRPGMGRWKADFKPLPVKREGTDNE